MKNIFVLNGDIFAKVDSVTWEDLEEEAKHRLFTGVKEEMITNGLKIPLETFIKWKVRRYYNGKRQIAKLKHDQQARRERRKSAKLHSENHVRMLSYVALHFLQGHSFIS